MVHALDPGELELLHADMPTTTPAASTQIRTLASISRAELPCAHGKRGAAHRGQGDRRALPRGKQIEAYAGYKALFSSPSFARTRRPTSARP